MHGLEEWLLPPRCVLTGEAATALDLSERLLNSWRRPQEVCPLCCEPSPGGRICGACLNAPPAFDLTRVGFYFESELVELVYRLKYQNQIAYGRLLGELLSEACRSADVDAILPVPLHPLRRRERGYNQAECIASSVAGELGIPMLRGALFRIRNTPSQTHLDAEARRKNLSGAFRVEANALAGLQRIALVDDVITTGATMHRLSEAIKQVSDIGYIEAWAVAKTQ